MSKTTVTRPTRRRRRGARGDLDLSLMLNALKCRVRSPLRAKFVEWSGELAQTLGLLLNTGRDTSLRVDMQVLGKTRAELYQPVCVQDRFKSRRVDGVDRDPGAWPTCARDARFGGFAQRSHRHRLPPRTDDYVPGGKRTEGSQDPGTRRTPARWSSAKPAPINGAASCPRGAHETDRASVASNAPPKPTGTPPPIWGGKKAAHRLPNIGQCHRRGAVTRWTARRPHH